MTDYDIIKAFDEVAADIYRDKEYFRRTYTEIAELRGYTSSFVKQKYASAKSVLKHQEQMWAVGLSLRARNALLRAGFRSKQEVYDVVSKGIVDLAELPDIGDKTRSEIREWLFNT